MRIHIPMLLTALSLLGSVQLLVACDGEGSAHPGVSSPAPFNNTTHPISTLPGVAAHGTSDSGGGTGVDGKVFESYAVDPTTLPAYQDHLKSLLEGMKDKTGLAERFDVIFKTKTWYIAPVQLEKIDKEVLGVSFLKSDTQQIARQTASEIWIDKALFDRMDSKAQSELILHEIIMSIYLVKFQHIKDFCSVFATTSDKDFCADSKGLVEAFDQSMPPEKAHALNEKDNENIRFVTGWLLENENKQIQAGDFFALLIAKNFDKRFFRPDEGDKSRALPDIKISETQLLNAVHGSELIRAPLEICKGISTGLSQNCKVQFSVSTSTFQQAQIQNLKIHVEIPGEAPIELNANMAGQPELFGDTDLDGSQVYSLALVEIHDQVRVGDRFYTGFMNFRRHPATPKGALILSSMVLIPGVVISIDKTSDPICQASAPKASRLVEDGLLIVSQNSKIGLEEQMQLPTPPIAACSPQNVQE